MFGRITLAAAWIVFCLSGQLLAQTGFQISDHSKPISAIPVSASRTNEWLNNSKLEAPYAPYSWQEQAAGGGQAGASGGGQAGGGGPEAAGAAAANNPGVPLSQWQFQNAFLPESYNSSGYANQFIVQPVIAIALKPDSYFKYHIVRATFPVLAPVADPDGPTPDIAGTGDITYFDLYFPESRREGVKWGVGPVAILPSSTNGNGLGEWQLGPSFAVINSSKKNWIYGFLIEVPFSLESNAYAIQMQPIFTRLLEDEWYVAIGDLLWKFDDQNRGYHIPLSFKVGRVIKAGTQPINIFLQPEYTPPGLTTSPTAAKYGIKLSVSFLLPGAKFGYNPDKACKSGCRGCRLCR